MRAPPVERVAGLPAVRVDPATSASDRSDAQGRDQWPPLVVVPGLNDPLYAVDDSRPLRWLVAGFCRRYAARRAVYYVSQPREGEDVAAIAAGYGPAVTALRERHGRPVALLGLSMGGFVAAAVAAARPDAVTRLALGLAGDRVDRESGRALLRRWDDHAAAGRWLPVYRSASDVVARGAWQTALRAAARVYDRLRSPSDPPAFRRAIDACLAYDGSALDRVAAAGVSTLVVGGDDDPFFTRAAFDRAADRTDGRRVRLQGVGHDAVLAGGAFDRVVRRFL